MSTRDEDRHVQAVERALQARYREAARDLYPEDGGNVQIDPDAVVSESDEGAYVAAWVWVPRDMVDPDDVT